MLGKCKIGLILIGWKEGEEEGQKTGQKIEAEEEEERKKGQWMQGRRGRGYAQGAPLQLRLTDLLCGLSVWRERKKMTSWKLVLLGGEFGGINKKKR